MTNELATVTPQNIRMAGTGASWCSINADGDRDKAKKIYNALNNPDERVANMINKKILLTDVLIEIRDIVDEETGIIEQVPRVVLIDADGKSYQATSVGMFNAIVNLINAFGEPTWAEPLEVEVKQVPTKRGSMLTLVC